MTGNFLVVLWQWDAGLSAAEGASELWSGMKDEQGVPYDTVPGTGVFATVSKAQQIYLTAHDATFTMRGNAERPPLLFMPQVRLDGASTLTLERPVGQIDGQALPLGLRLELAGSLEATLARSGDRVGSEILAGLGSASVDGKPLQVAAVVATPVDAGGPGLALWALAAAAGLALCILFTRKTRASWHLRRAMHWTQQHHYRRALLHCTLAVQAYRPGPEQHVLRGVLLGRLERPRPALREHERAHQQMQGLDGVSSLLAQNALEAALTCHGLDDRGGVLRWLREASAADPARFYAQMTQREHKALRPYMVQVLATPGYA